jgi:hypothetical protein
MIEVTRDVSTTETRLSPGDFASFRYRDEEGKPSVRDILVTRYDEEEKLLHGLDLDKFTDENLIQVGRELARFANRRDDYEERLAEDGSITIDILDHQIEDWYDLRYSNDRFEENPYRTFREDRIRVLYKTNVIVTDEQ